MTTRPSNQHATGPKGQFKVILIDLTENLGLTQVEIADALKIKPGSLNKVFKGKRKGSDQLLAGLQLLKKLTVLERQEKPELPGARLDRELETMKDRIRQIEEQLRGKVLDPEPTPKKTSVEEVKQEILAEAVKLVKPTEGGTE